MHKRDTNLNITENIINQEYGLLSQIEMMKASQRNLFEQSFPYLDRYSDIKPYKNNTIKISTPIGYINASPINIGEKQNLFISTQGPKKETIEDFWTMVYDLNSKVIVML